MARLPMFPLGMTLLPGSAVPLNVFESRYVAMVRELLQSGDEHLEFGIVMIERGFEVGGGDVRADVATLGRIIEISALPGDQYALLVQGVERIRVVEWLDDDPYPTADVEPWPEPDAELSDEELQERIERVLAAGTELNDMVRELGHDEVPALERAEDDTDTLYLIAAQTPLGAVDRYRVLAAASVAARCDALEQAIADARAVLEFHRS